MLKTMYNIVLLTPCGIVTELYDSNTTPLEEFEKQMITKYKTFILQSYNPI